MYACHMTLTYLRGALSTCSVCMDVCTILFPKVYKIVDATMQRFLLKALTSTAYTFCSESRLRLRNSFLQFAPFALVCDYERWTENDDSYRPFVNS